MCFPTDAFSSCGTVRGITETATLQCPGPGVVDLGGIGVWVESKFDLDGYLGQRIQIRWIGQSWVFDAGPNGSYFEIASGFDTTQKDDGWWVDTIKVTGAITNQLPPEADTKANAPGSCPATAGDNCAQSPIVPCPLGGSSDNGTCPRLDVVNLSNTPIDNVTSVAERGEALRISAIASSLAGGCTGGVAQFKFTKDTLLPDGSPDGSPAVLVQDWNGKTFFQDSPETDTLYSVQVRCSSDFSCESTTGATTTVRVYPGDGTDLKLTLTSLSPTTISWVARPQPAPMDGYDLFKATQPGPPSGPVSISAFTTCLATDVPQGPIGSTISVIDTADPAVNSAFLYLVGHSHPVAAARTALGRAFPGSFCTTAGCIPSTVPPGPVRISPVSCP
jgi:hypothetical protein